MTEQDTPNEFATEGLANLVQAAVANGMVQTGPTGEQVSSAATLAVLAHLGGNKTQEDALTFEGTKFVLPANYKGNLAAAVVFLAQWQEQQETKTDMKRVFDYRPYDVAHAVQSALKTIFGTTGTGETIQTFFGPVNPEFVTVATGVGQTVQVPWNRLRFDAVEGHIDIDSKRTPNGWVGEITVSAPRKYRSVIEGLFIAIEAELRSNSIYRGKAIISGEYHDIQFLDLSSVRRENVVYSDQVMRDLEANIWVPLRHTQEMRDMGQPVKRSILLSGPFGTGKTMAAYLTAQEAVANGWTFIFVKPGSDLNEAMQTAKLYGPAVVFFEDIDVLQSNDPEAVSKLLDAFDGITGKGQEVIAILTTNYAEKIHKGMLRPGRLDAMIEIGALDRSGIEKLIKVSIPAENLSEDIDYADVFLACRDYLPAFVREVAARAVRYAITRAGIKYGQLTTEDFVAAAEGLRPQFELMNSAHEVQKPPTLDAAFYDLLERQKPLDGDGDPSFWVRNVKMDRS